MSDFDRKSAAYWKAEYEDASQKAQTNDNLRWLLTQAKSALENYGRHFTYCCNPRPPGASPTQACTCGLAAAIEAASPEKAEAARAR
jgi:hypothetical protein